MRVTRAREVRMKIKVKCKFNEYEIITRGKGTTVKERKNQVRNNHRDRDME